MPALSPRVRIRGQKSQLIHAFGQMFVEQFWAVYLTMNTLVHFENHAHLCLPFHSSLQGDDIVGVP